MPPIIHPPVFPRPCHLLKLLCLLEKVKSRMGSTDSKMSMVDSHLRQLLWVCCPGHAWVKRNDRADRLAGKATLTSTLLLGSSEVLRSLRHCQRAQGQVRHSIDRLEERGVERDDLASKDERGDRQSDEHWNRFKGKVLGNCWETGWNVYGLFRTHRYYLELNGIKTLSSSPSFHDNVYHSVCGQMIIISRSPYAYNNYMSVRRQ